MIVLKIIGWILLGILGLIAAVLVIAVIAMCFRVKLNVEYSSENTSAMLKYLFLKIPLYPRPKKEKDETEEKPKKKKTKKPDEKEEKEDNVTALSETVSLSESADLPEEEAEADAEETKEPEKKKSGAKELLETLYNAEGIDGLTLLARRTCRYLGTFFGGLIGGVIVDEFDLDVCCTKPDAAAAAIYYGEVCSTLFPLLASLAAKCKLKKHNINVYPDYLARFSSASFILDLHFTPIVMVGHILALVIKILFKIVLQLVVKIFLYLKNGKKTGNENKNIKEKSEITNE